MFSLWVRDLVPAGEPAISWLAVAVPERDLRLTVSRDIPPLRNHKFSPRGVLEAGLAFFCAELDASAGPELEEALAVRSIIRHAVKDEIPISYVH